MHENFVLYFSKNLNIHSTLFLRIEFKFSRLYCFKNTIRIRNCVDSVQRYVILTHTEVNMHELNVTRVRKWLRKSITNSSDTMTEKGLIITRGNKYVEHNQHCSRLLSQNTYAHSFKESVSLSLQRRIFSKKYSRKYKHNSCVKLPSYKNNEEGKEFNISTSVPLLRKRHAALTVATRPSNFKLQFLDHKMCVYGCTLLTFTHLKYKNLR